MFTIKALKKRSMGEVVGGLELVLEGLKQIYLNATIGGAAEELGEELKKMIRGTATDEDEAEPEEAPALPEPEAISKQVPHNAAATNSKDEWKKPYD